MIPFEQFPPYCSRLFAVGASISGMFCHYLAARAADLFTTVAPIIGGLPKPVAARFQPNYSTFPRVIQGEGAFSAYQEVRPPCA
ncbi:MAG: hypothetical protein RMM08_12260 [Armatimonadota bacterium]|nr:hypothetical protein [bacterium]MDW8322123.1 hypothetical protein [Armatimonadota bacterium]